MEQAFEDRLTVKQGRDKALEGRIVVDENVGVGLCIED